MLSALAQAALEGREGGRSLISAVQILATDPEDRLAAGSGGERTPMFKLSKADSHKIMAAIKRTEEPAAALMAAVAAYNKRWVTSPAHPNH